MKKILIYSLFFFFLGNIPINSQTIKLNNNDTFSIKKIDDSSIYLLRIEIKNKYFIYRLKELKMPKNIKNIYTFNEIKKISKTENKMFSLFDGLSYGSGHFIIRNKYYDNLGSSIP